MSAALKRKISAKKAKIAVVGLGYVGLPLAVKFARAGFSVTGLDRDEDRIARIQDCQSYILDVTSKELRSVVKTGKLQAMSRFDVLLDIDVIMICVPTPLKRKYTPDISYILGAVRIIRRFLKKQTLIILESTTYPGTTKELIKPELEKSGKKVGRDIYLAFSPERIDPGNKQFDVTRIPKVVGGLTPQASALTKMLYEKVIKKVYVVSSAETAEMTKLLENSFRIINIGWINEVAMMCHRLGIDVWEVIEAAKTKPFGFMPFYPGLGVGGHCIPDDPLYLYWKAKQYGFSSKYIKLSADTNASMPFYAVDRLGEILAARKKTIRHSRILIIGVTYKKDVKDLRKSPPLTLMEILKNFHCRTAYHDPIIPYLNIGMIKENSVVLSPRVLKSFDCIIIATDHTHVNYKMILKHAKLIFDIRNVFSKIDNKKVIKL